MDISEKWFAIINPAAGSGRGLAHWPWISKLLRDNGVIPDYAFTEHKYHATELVVSAVTQGYRKIISIGGDGTLHEIINGIFIQNIVPSTELVIGVIATGTGTDWIRKDQAKKYPDAVRAIAAGYSMPHDIGRVSYHKANYKQYRYMANMAGIGMDAYIVKRNNRLRESGRKHSAVFIWKTIKSILRYRPTGVRIWVDGKLVIKELIFGAAIGLGGLNGIIPDRMPFAVADDGLFDITILRRISKLRAISRLKKFYNGRIYEQEKASHLRGKAIYIESRPEIGLEVDGEMLGYTPF